MPRLTLTFDNGPSPGATEAVLDILGTRFLRATFFVVGERLAAPEGLHLAEQATAAGHWIGNHTMTHGTPLGLRDDPEHAVKEIAATQELIGTLSHPDRYFRPNGKGSLGPHLLSPSAADLLIAHHYTVVTWNNVPRDWGEPRSEWPERALVRLAKHPWSVLVLHEHYLASMMDTLPRFLDRILADSIEIVQDFPEECMPLHRGKPRDGFWNLVSEPSRAPG
jgi:peptidoglycan/xylan/chitin deacetylase (PgdA/CDA1 family)